jgi:hypothetical protein
MLLKHILRFPVLFQARYCMKIIISSAGKFRKGNLVMSALTKQEVQAYLRPQPMMRQDYADSATLTHFISLWSEPGTPFVHTSFRMLWIT